MRRKDREMPESFAYGVADKCEWAVLSMLDPDGAPYGVPLSIAREGTRIYFHCAPDGAKTAALRAHADVCLVCVGDTHRMADKFTTEYESAILRGTVSEVRDAEEKIRALQMLCLRHTPLNMAAFDEAVAKSLARTAVWRIDVTDITGKRKKYDARGVEMKFGRMEE